jgi:protein phosphatase
MAAVSPNSTNPLPLPTPAASSAEATNPVQQAAVSPNSTTTKLSSAEVAALAAGDKGHLKPGFQLLSSSLTDVGLSRKGGVNEDSYFTIELKRCFEGNPESFGFYMVADGMGGQAAGEVASRTAIETVGPRILAELAGPWMAGLNLDISQIEQVLQEVIGAAHTRLYEFNHQEQIDSGTTVTACCAVGRSAVFANVGDSRTYLFRPARAIKPAKEAPTEPAMSDDESNPANRKTRKLDEPTRKLDDKTDKLNPEALKQAKEPKLLIERVTRDQSLVQHLVEQGDLTIDEVYDDPRRNVILFALGAPDETIPVDTYHRELEIGDTVLLCSDGLWEMVRDPAMADYLVSQPDLGQVARTLVDQANQNGGADNITVILVRVI